MIYTSNFRLSGQDPRAVAISRGVPRGYTGLRYLALAPPRSMLKLPLAEFVVAYQFEILGHLDALTVYNDLRKAETVILLCWEDALRFYCHRRHVAQWLEDAITGVTVAEFGHARSESPRWQDMPAKPPSTRWTKAPGPSHGCLFGSKD
jgi:hypothetical protein